MYTHIKYWGLAITVFLLVYLLWRQVVNFLQKFSKIQTHDLKTKERLNTFYVFWLPLIQVLFVGVIVLRILYIYEHSKLYQGIPWGVSPYIKGGNNIVWFYFFPWRFLRFNEGVAYNLVFILVVFWGLAILIRLNRLLRAVSFIPERIKRALNKNIVLSFVYSLLISALIYVLIGL